MAACTVYREPCQRHGFVHGAEAEELRNGVERIIHDASADIDNGGCETTWIDLLRRLLDRVDARDSLAFLERRDHEPSDRGGAQTERVQPARVCVAALITDSADRVLLVRNRKRNTAAGRPVWELPGGGIEPGETWREAAEREVMEEAGVAVMVDGIEDVLHGDPRPGAPYRSLILVARGCGENTRPVAGDDAIAAAWFARGALPALAPLTSADVVQRWDGAGR